MGDPAGACAHGKERPAPGWTLILVEPFGGDALSENLNPLGAAYYVFSTLLCTPRSLSQRSARARGSGGRNSLREIAISAGFGALQRVAETPFNVGLAARL
jgi:hypothetical protein